MYIHGIDVTLYIETPVGVDEFDREIKSEEAVIVHNVLVGQPTAKEVSDELDLTGRRAQYTLSIPKGDTHEWENKKVEFFGKTFRTIGSVTQYIEDLVPGDWNKRIMVESYE